MHLAKIELQGFKSFPDRTVFEFANGITAILGPNGCGKSNVVDAIKWVLGESNARNLRGEQMTDVIFAGSEGRKPMGMAEVNLYFNNEDGALPIAYSEVCITRRLYRTGESEYLLNGTPCLRRQIRELFLDTGIGSSAYSFIEQGKVEELVTAKPEERRTIFEEAAGIAKYKLRRKETLARLERTQQHLLRVNDIIAETERGIRRLSRQAANARRYQKLKAELDGLRRHLYGRQYATLAERHRRVAEERAALEALYAEESGRQAQRAQRLGDLTAQEMALSKEAEASDAAANAWQEKISAIAAEMAGAAERAAALKKSAADSAERETAIAERLKRYDEDTAQLAAQEADLSRLLAEEEATLKTTETAVASLQKELDEAEAKTAEARRRCQIAAEDKNQALARLARLEGEMQLAAQTLAELLERSQALTAAAEHLAEAVAGAKANCESLRAACSAADAALAESRRCAEEARAENTRLAKRLAELAASRSRCEGRLATLRDLEASREGVHAGPRRILAAMRAGDQACAAVRGMIADLIAVDPQVALAIDTALGAMAQAIVVDTAAAAQNCIDLLKRERAGRATFLPLDLIRPRPRLPRDLLTLPGVKGEAVDLIRFDENIRPAAEYLLAGILVVESLARGRELAAGQARGIRIVTLEGEIIHPAGAMTGGWSRETTSGLLQRKAESDRLAHELEDISRETAEVETQQAEARAREEKALAACRQCEGECQARRAQLAEAEKSLAIALREMDRCHEENRQRLDEQKRLEGKRAEYEAQHLELRTEITAKETAEAEAASHLAAVSAGQDDIRRAASERLAEVAKWREQRATTVSRLAMVQARQKSLAEERQKAQEESERCRQAIAAAEAESAALGEHRRQLEEEEGHCLRLRDEQRAAATATRQRLAEVRESIHTERSEEQAGQQRLQKTMEALGDLRNSENECRLRMENLAQKAREELQENDLAAIAAHGQPPANASSASAAGETIPDDFAALLADGGSALFVFGEDTIGRWIEEHLAKISRLGPIDPQAVDDLAEMEARKTFLESERDDLAKAVQDLQTVIERLNRECARQFDENFQAVRGHFAEMFRILFGGGKADLVLEPAADPLERGVEIIARPPGKEPTSISLLSGGEKALATVALLFALLRAKPTPFCVLDEVDGPLDESNIDRFMSVLRDFAQDTQFILISHSKRTMGMTDNIYGVTQDEPGVSRKYSLRFRTADAVEAERSRRAAAAGSAKVMAG